MFWEIVLIYNSISANKFHKKVLVFLVLDSEELMSLTLSNPKSKPSNKPVLKKTQELLSTSIKHLDDELSTSLFHSRKILELLINSYFEIKGMKKGRNPEGYSTLALLIDNIRNNKLTPEHITEAMYYVKNNGNKIAHKYDFNPTKTIGQETIKSISTIIVWYLEELKLMNNSLGLLAIRRAKMIKEKLNKGESIYLLNNILNEILKTDPINEFDKCKLLAQQLNQFDIIDKELLQYSKKMNDVATQYQKFKNSNSFLSGGATKIFSKFFNQPLEIMSDLIFKKRYKLKLKKINELRTLISTRYAIK